MSTPDTDKEKLQKLVQALGDENFEVREKAQLQLIAIGEPVLKILLEASLDKDPEISHRAAASIKEINHNLNVAKLVVRLEKGTIEERHEAARQLFYLGPKAVKAVPALLRAIYDTDVDVRRLGMSALSKIGPVAKAAIPKLIAITEDENETDDIRSSAIITFLGFGKLSTAAIPCLLKLMNGKNVNLIRVAAGIIGDIGKECDDAVPVLLKLLKHEDGDVRGRAAASLGKIGKQPDVLVPLFIELIKKEKKPMLGIADPRQGILSGLILLGPHAKPAIPLILEMVATPDEYLIIQQRGIQVLVAIGPKAKEALPLLQKLRHSDDWIGLHQDVDKAIKAINKP